MESLESGGQIASVHSLSAELYGSLGATGLGHGSDRAVLAGLAKHSPESVDPNELPALWDRVGQSGQLELNPGQVIPFHLKKNITFLRKSLPFHPNGMIFRAVDGAGQTLLEKT